MDTKLKSSKKIRIIITICALLVMTIANVIYFPVIGNRASSEYSEQMTEQKEINTDLMQALYQGALVMYYEQTLQSSEEVIEPLDLFIKKESLNEDQQVALEENFSYIFGRWVSNFERYNFLHNSFQL